MTRTGIKVDLDVGDVVSGASKAKSAISSIEAAMKRVSVGSEEHAKLAYTRDRLQAQAAGYDRSLSNLANAPKLQGIGASGQPVFKIDSSYESLLRTQINTEKSLIAALTTAANADDADAVMSLSTQLSKVQKDFAKTCDEVTGNKPKEKIESDAMKSMFAQQMINAVNSGMSLYVSGLDRTGVINALGQGDLMGGGLAEKQRRTNMLSGGLQTAGALFQGAGTLFGPVGMAIGTGGNFFANLAAKYFEKEQTDTGNRYAYAGLWDSHKDQAMELAAITGKPSNVRGKWKEAATVAEKYGYSAEEGAELVKSAAMQGLGANAADKVFDFERRTGADRSALSSLSYLSERYGDKDAMQAAWRGLKASGLQTAQYNEILRGLQRVVEDGISKGYVRSSEQVARNLTMLSQMTNGNPLWTGEQGVQRLSKINAGLESTVGLQSTSDMIAFRAAKRVLGDNARYEDVLALQERGISDKKYGTQFMKEIMNIAKETEAGDRSGIVEILRGVFKFNYNEATTFHDSWKKNGEKINDVQLNAALKAQGLPPGVTKGTSEEYNFTLEAQKFRNLVIEAGQGFYKAVMGESLADARKSYQDTTGKLLPGAGNTDVRSVREVTGNPNATSIRDAASWIDSRTNMLLPSYFSERGDKRASDKFDSMIRNARRGGNDNELQATFETIQKLDKLPDPVRKDWDKRNVLNPIINESTSMRDVLTALNRLIELTEKNGEVTLTFNQAF